MNQQIPVKKSHSEDGSLRVHSIFHTIQGEGPFTGLRAVFVRLAGCNLQCPLCDTDYTSHSGAMTPDEIVTGVRQYGTKGHLVVITGGEPFLQNLRPTVEALLKADFHVQIETNGTLFQDLPFDSVDVVCSPKTGSINRQLEPNLVALKYVICSEDISEEDGLPTLALKHPLQSQLARPTATFDGIIYVQPADEGDAEKNRKNQEAAVASALKYGYVLQLQVHKLIGVQ